MNTIFEERYAAHPADVKQYDTARLRAEFLVEKIFEADTVRLTYSMYDRYMVGGVMPVGQRVALLPVDALKADYFCERREVGLINVGGRGSVEVDGVKYEIGYKEALYIGRGSREVWFASESASEPARFYLNSAPAHKAYPVRKVTMADAEVVEMGSLEGSNHRKINKLLVNSVLDTCQLQMGMTELKPGSVWNTMPPHTHNRRMEAYFYFEVPQGQAICHFMGDPRETRHIWMGGEQAVFSPAWSIHSAAGTSNYTFIWGMAGENLNYGDMDVVQPNELR